MAMTSSCHLGKKRYYPSRDAALAGAEDIRVEVTAQGRKAYDQLYPYLCPSGGHWHLSHYRQGTARCLVCLQRGPAWLKGEWIMGKHIDPTTGRDCCGRTTMPKSGYEE